MGVCCEPPRVLVDRSASPNPSKIGYFRSYSDLSRHIDFDRVTTSDGIDFSPDSLSMGLGSMILCLKVNFGLQDRSSKILWHFRTIAFYSDTYYCEYCELVDRVMLRLPRYAPRSSNELVVGKWTVGQRI